MSDSLKKAKRIVEGETLAHVMHYLAGKLDRIAELKIILNAALDHQLSNRGTEYEFYSCYIYQHGEVPAWVTEAKAALEAPDEPT